MTTEQTQTHLDPVDSNQLTDDLVNSAVGGTQTVLYSQDSRFIQVEMIAGTIFTGFVLFAALIGLGVLWIILGLGPIFYLGLLAFLVLTLLLLYGTYVWPKIEFRHYRWRLDDQSLEIHSGVWWKHRISIPLGRVQHADVSQGPLLRKFDLGVLTVHTAGTAESKIELKGLAHSTAMQLRDRLVEQAQAKVVT